MSQDKTLQKKDPLHPLVILAIILVIAAVATYFLPAGNFDRVEDPVSGYELVEPGTFHYAEKNPTGPFQFFVNFTLGMQGAAGIIFLILIIGGSFQIITETGALHAGMTNLVRALKGRELLMIPVTMITFGLISAFAACCEEYLAFLPIVYVAVLACGFDSITAVAMLFCASAAGYAGGLTNAFTIGVAQTIAGLPLFSGMQLRIVIFVVMITVTMIYTAIHAIRMKKYPEKNPLLHIDQKYGGTLDVSEEVVLTGRQKGVLVIFFGGFAVVVFCVIKFGFYLDEMCAIFLIMGILSGIVGGLSANRMAEAVVTGARDLLGAALIVGVCKAVTIVLQDANVLDTIIHGLGTLLDGVHSNVAACGMFMVQNTFSLVVPSGSGQAAITMPFMAPLADILGFTRQTAVLAFQFGDAFTNVVSPTNGELMAALAICHVPFKNWLKFILPLWLIWSVIACIFMIYAVNTGYGPF